MTGVQLFHILLKLYYPQICILYITGKEIDKFFNLRKTFPFKHLKYSADALWDKNFVKIALSRSISEINKFLRFMQKFKMAAKSSRKIIFWGKLPEDCRYLAGQKFCRNRSISLRFRDKLVFAFNAEIQDGRQKWRENDFLEKSPVDSEIPCRSKISSKLLFRSVSEINALLRFQR